MIRESFELADAIYSIAGEIRVITRHLIKCWYILNDELCHHWCNELRTHLENIADYSYNVKIKKGRISEKKFRVEFPNICNERTVKLAFESIESEYGIKVTTDILCETQKRLHVFYDELFRTLGNNTFSIEHMLRIAFRFHQVVKNIKR